LRRVKPVRTLQSSDELTKSEDVMRAMLTWHLTWTTDRECAGQALQGVSPVGQYASFPVVMHNPALTLHRLEVSVVALFALGITAKNSGWGRRLKTSCIHLLAAELGARPTDASLLARVEHRQRTATGKSGSQTLPRQLAYGQELQEGWPLSNWNRPVGQREQSAML
jgi:hypothetical protein